MDSIVQDAIEEAEEEDEDDLSTFETGSDDESSASEDNTANSGQATEQQQVQEEQTQEQQSQSRNQQQEQDEPNPLESENAESDVGVSADHLDEVIRQQSTSITVVGCGGAGCNTVSRIREDGISGANLAALNTDAQHLRRVHREDKDNEITKVLLGEESRSGEGAGAKPRFGEQAAREDEDDIRKIVEDEDLVFITAGMGGGTGTGAAPIVAENAKQEGALTIAVVTMPFSAEGKQRMRNAKGGLRQLYQKADTVVVLPNDRLKQEYPNVPIQKAFDACDSILSEAVRSVTDIIKTEGLINVDYADVETILEQGEVALIGVGESDSTSDKAKASVQDAINSKLIDVDISSADNALVYVRGDEEMTIEEAEGAVQYVNNEIDDESRIIWGAETEQDRTDGMLRSLVIITGVESPQIFGGTGDGSLDEF